MNKEPFTEITTIDDTTVKIEVFTDDDSTTEKITFTSKLSLTNYIDRLRKNLSKQIDEETGEIIQPQINIPLCIIDTIRNTTLKFNMTEQSQEVTQNLNHQTKRSDKLRFIPKTMVKVEKSSKDIRKERIKEIMRDIKFGDINQAKHKLDKYFEK
tara:strand:+ start:196 stop:660 length:465 start_codon:yes stop_codon:yes gene_type:complete